MPRTRLMWIVFLKPLPNLARIDFEVLVELTVLRRMLWSDARKVVGYLCIYAAFIALFLYERSSGGGLHTFFLAVVAWGASWRVGHHAIMAFFSLRRLRRVRDDWF